MPERLDRPFSFLFETLFPWILGPSRLLLLFHLLIHINLLLEHENPSFYPCFCLFATVRHRKLCRTTAIGTEQRLAVFVLKRSLFSIEIAMNNWFLTVLALQADTIPSFARNCSNFGDRTAALQNRLPHNREGILARAACNGVLSP